MPQEICIIDKARNKATNRIVMEELEISTDYTAVHRGLQRRNHSMPYYFHVDGFEITGDPRDDRKSDNYPGQQVEHFPIARDQNLVDDVFNR